MREQVISKKKKEKNKAPENARKSGKFRGFRDPEISLSFHQSGPDPFPLDWLFRATSRGPPPSRNRSWISLLLRRFPNAILNFTRFLHAWAPYFNCFSSLPLFLPVTCLMLFSFARNCIISRYFIRFCYIVQFLTAKLSLLPGGNALFQRHFPRRSWYILPLPSSPGTQTDIANWKS